MKSIENNENTQWLIWSTLKCMYTVQNRLKECVSHTAPSAHNPKRTQITHARNGIDNNIPHQFSLAEHVSIPFTFTGLLIGRERTIASVQLDVRSTCYMCVCFCCAVIFGSVLVICCHLPVFSAAIGTNKFGYGTNALCVCARLHINRIECISILFLFNAEVQKPS